MQKSIFENYYIVGYSDNRKKRKAKAKLSIIKFTKLRYFLHVIPHQ